MVNGFATSTQGWHVGNGRLRTGMESQSPSLRGIVWRLGGLCKESACGPFFNYLILPSALDTGLAHPFRNGGFAVCWDEFVIFFSGSLRRVCSWCTWTRTLPLTWYAVVCGTAIS